MKNTGSNRRGKTDSSLTGERSKTDEYIQVKGEKNNKDIMDKITKNRTKSDIDKKNARKALDKRTDDSRNDSSVSSEEKSKLQDNDLAKERQRADDALQIDRDKEDNLRVSERAQAETIHDSSLTKERSETDSNLLDERMDVDKESKKSKEDLTKQIELVTSSKTDLATRDEFLAVVSHDLKNPLGSILMSAQLMKDNIQSGNMDDQLAMIDVIERNATVMNRMITDLLDVERMTNGKLELNLKEINICDLLKDCKLLFNPLVIRNELTLVVDECNEKLMASCDHDKILQVLSNLVGNSLKFTPKGGVIKISIKDNPLSISVTDNGIGISKEDQKLLFNKFSQLKSKDRSGLGLGLFICKWIVQAHGGEIFVRSDLNKGSEFTFTLGK